MVKYGYAVGVLVALALGSSEAFAPARSLVAPLRLELRGMLRRDMSASTLYNPEDNNDIQGAFRTMSSDYLDSLSGALSDDDDPYEVEIALKKQMVKARADRTTLGTYRVSFVMAAPLGMTLCQMDPGLVFSDVDLNVDTLTSQAAPLAGANANLATIDLKTTKERLGPSFRGLLVSSVVKEGRAWKAGIRPGDILAATSATVGDAMWPKSSLDGVRSAIASRKVVSGVMDFQFQRVDVPVPVSRQTYELTLTRPIGIEIEETSDGYVEVTGFTEIAPKLVKYAVKVGDRILAVDSSLGGSMWPVSTTAGVISACTSRLPGQSVTMRFERPTVSIVGEPSASTVSSSSSSVPTRSAVLPTTGGATPETLLKRCRDVLRKYNSEEQQNERTKFSGKYAVPALVADKVLDAVASASVSLDAKTLSLVMNAYLSCKQPAGAIRAFEAAVGISADGSSSQATTTIEGKERGSLVPNYGALNVYTASSLMRAHSLLGDIGSVRRVLAALEGQSGLDISGKETGTWPNYGSMVPDTQLYNIALSATAKSGESSSLEDLLAVFNSMEDRSGREGRPVKDRVSHNTVINALAKAGKYEESFTAFYTMKRSGIKPDKFTYTSLVKACVQEGDMQELLFDMQEKGVKPDLVMYNFMIKTLCEGGQWYEAKKLVTQMEAAGIAPDSMTYGFLMNGLLIANKPSACLSLFEAACADSKTIPLTENVHLYTTAISAASALENHEKAFFLINRMNVAGVKPNLKTMTALMGACMSSGKYTLATEVYKQMEKPDSFAMSKGVEAFCLNGNYEEAMKILSNKECVKGLSGKQQMVAYGHLLRTSLAGGNMEVGRATFKAFLGAGFIPSKLTFQLMIQALEMVPPKKRNLPFAKPISDENFGFVLFVLDSIHNRNLPCDSEFYTSVLLAGSRIGGLRRKICSLMTESRAQTEEPESKQSQTILDENTAARLSVIGWEDLLNNYDARKADLGVSLRLPSLTVRMGREEVRQVLSAEQEVTYRGGANRKPKAKTTQNFVSSE